MCFTYVLAGWEGSAHDTRIFTDTIRRQDGNFPHPSGDKYYLVDAGYPNSRGYLAPYKGTHIRYHFQDFRRGKTRGARTPKGTEERFNYIHSSLRNVIERTFGVWKARWSILKDMHVNYTIATQIDIIVASMAIHNYIRMKHSQDDAFLVAQNEAYDPHEEVDPQDVPFTQGEGSSSQRSEDVVHMNAIRNIIANAINANFR
ncbi:unnamed protein product [Cuscuta europaea]|nr:unnamed protein product [Cuscuta europaea]